MFRIRLIVPRPRFHLRGEFDSSIVPFVFSSLTHQLSIHLQLYVKSQGRESSPRKGILTLEPGTGRGLQTPDGIPKTTAKFGFFLVQKKQFILQLNAASQTYRFYWFSRFCSLLFYVSRVFYTKYEPKIHVSQQQQLVLLARS